MSSIGLDSAVLSSILVYTLLAYSVQAPLRAGIFSLSGIGCFAIGGYGTGFLSNSGLDTGLALVAGVALAGGVNWLLSFVLVRLRSLYLAMATTAFVVILGVVATNATTVTGGGLGMFIAATVPLWLLAVLAVVASIVLFLAERGVSGRSAVVSREDEDLASTMGIDIARQRRLMFLVSGAAGGLAGALYVLTVGNISPETAGFTMIILVLTMVILGGLGSWVGALLGTLILTWLPLQISSLGDWWPVLYGILLTLVAVYAPGGLLGLGGDLRRRIRARGASKNVQQPVPAEVGATS